MRAPDGDADTVSSPHRVGVPRELGARRANRVQSRSVIAVTAPTSGRRRPLAGSVMQAYCLGCLRDPESRAASQPSCPARSRQARGAGAGTPRRIARHRSRDSRWRSTKLARIATVLWHFMVCTRHVSPSWFRVPPSGPDGPLGGPTESPQVRASGGDPHKKPAYVLPGFLRLVSDVHWPSPSPRYLPCLRRLMRPPPRCRRARARRPGRPGQGAGIVEQHDAVAKQAPPLLGMASHGPCGDAIRRQCIRAAGLMSAHLAVQQAS